MREAFSHLASSRSVAVLLHPSIVPVIDVFRSLDSLEDQYDLALLDGPEQALAAHTQPEAAKGIISDSLLLAFALARQRGRPFSHRPIGSRQGSMDEYCLLTMISTSRRAIADVALEAAAFLEVTSLDFMAALAGELVRQIDCGTLVFVPPSLPEFKAITGREFSERVLIDTALSKVEFNFRH